MVIMFTVIVFGLLVIMGVFRIQRSTASLLISVLAAFSAWGLIGVKRLNFLLQRTGRFDQTFSLTELHLFEVASSLMLLLILLFPVGPDSRPDLQEGILRMVMAWFNHPERLPALLLLVGLAITSYGIGVLFRGDFIVYFVVVIGLVTVTAAAGVWAHRDPVAQMAGFSLTIYILVLVLASSCTEGGWGSSVI
ncbi:hypothetical protein HU200_041180 [Digitaria exilis]|uniref:Uncharacterized protein n=1 Tax=Digitaria exilis TaxID=1010633 RepID=A0A835B9W0_9POAL|nr:hypothetical protein HU200_041180 [Digitaria exilis]